MLMKELISGDIKIRPITRQDTELIVSWRNNPDVKKQFIFQGDFTAELHNNWLTTQVNTGRVAQFIIELLPESTLIGSVYLRDIDMLHNKAEFGIFLSCKEVMGKGYGTIVTNLILQYAFEDLQLNKVFLRVLSENKRAVKSYLKSGFQLEGEFKEDVRINDEYKDVTFMAIFADEGRGKT